MKIKFLMFNICTVAAAWIALTGLSHAAAVYSEDTAQAEKLYMEQMAQHDGPSAGGLKGYKSYDDTDAVPSPPSWPDTSALTPQAHALSRPAEVMVGSENEDIDELTVEAIREDLVIDESFIRAKDASLPEAPVLAPVEAVESVILTDEQIIHTVLADDLRGAKIDLDFDAVPLGDIFMTLGKAGNINVLVDPALKDQPLDIHLQQVSIEEAFILISNAYALGYKKVGGSLYVTSEAKLREQNLVSKVIKLHNVHVQDVKALLENVLQSVNISEELNSIIAVGTPAEIQEVENIIQAIDLPQPQVILEARIVEVNKDALRDLGVDWSDQINLTYQESGRPVDFEDPEDSQDGVLEIGALQRNALQFTTALRILENQNKAKVLSNPRITTLNDKEAEIFVGDRIPYTVTTVSGGVATTDVRFEEPGIRLRITPSIIEDDFVVIKVEPEVSFIFAFRGADSQYPHTKKRQATAYVRVKNNQSFILGGLLNQEDKKNLFKVPFLGDVPLLGNLFSYERNSVLDTELIITITPTIVRGGI